MATALVDTYADRLPLRRTGFPDDVARVALFCASDLATFMTGSTLLADGGDVAV
jgi:NAD(P)-dependent dehydrogenase (short-subunit alcohol dehydrogenase family)